MYLVDLHLDCALHTLELLLHLPDLGEDKVEGRVLVTNQGRYCFGG